MSARRVDWDPLADTALADPVAAHAELRDRCPVAYSDRWGGFWALTRHEDVLAAALDLDTFVSGQKTTIPDSTGPERPPRPPLEADRPEHTRYRRILARYFVPARMAYWEPAVRQVAVDLVDAAVAKRECDAVLELTHPLPAGALCVFLGLPLSDRGRIKRWANEVLEAARAGDAEAHRAANERIYGYVERLVEQRRAEPLDPELDMTTGLLQADMEGEPLTDDEVAAVLRLMLQAGHGTTTNALGSALRHLSEHPDDQRRLREDPSLIPAAVEEILRCWAPAQLLARTTTRDVEVRGRTLAAGEKVALMWASANRDPAAFDAPDRCDLARSPNRQVAFGHGIHRCIGAPLARAELRIVLEELLARTRSFALTGRVEEAGWPHLGPRSLPMRFDV